MSASMEKGPSVTPLTFPQYLWRIGFVGGVIIRRGNDCNEPVAKSLKKDWLQAVMIGVLDYCDVTDAQRYSADHDWDWLNA